MRQLTMKNCILKNDKTLEEALLVVTKKSVPHNDKSGNSYFKIEEYVERMNEAFGGRTGYRETYQTLPFLTLPSGQVMLQCHCHIDILSQDGSVAFFVEGEGSFEIAYSENNERYINLQTASMNCSVNAFKSACRNLGIFGCRELEEGNEGNNNRNGRGTNSAYSTNHPVHTKTFYVSKPLEEFWKDSTGKPAYRIVGKLVENNAIGDKDCEILMYPNQYKNCVSKLNELILKCQNTQKGFRLTVGVSEVDETKRNVRYAGSYTFKKFGEGA